MRKLFMLGAVLAAVVFPAASHAQDSKFSLGLRLGYGMGMGDYAKTADGSTAISQSDVVGSLVPLQLDAMYRVTPEWAIGGYLSYAFGSVTGDAKDLCDAYGEDCSASALRVGLQATYSFVKASPTFVPWAGIGTGFESLTIKEEVGGASASTDTTGWEILNLQVGGDYKVNPQFAIGPYLMYSVGQYSSIEGNSIPEKSMHEFFNLGVRGKFDL